MYLGLTSKSIEIWKPCQAKPEKARLTKYGWKTQGKQTPPSDGNNNAEEKRDVNDATIFN